MSETQQPKPAVCILNGEEINNIMNVLGEVPTKWGAPIIEILTRNLREVEAPVEEAPVKGKK
jgi:hypothetical protein